jgi:hypothetical protein
MNYRNALLTFLLLLVSTPSFAGSTAITGKAGTLGAGLELMHYFNPSFSGRVGFNSFSYDFTRTDDDIRYDYELDLSTFSMLVDWHPMEGPFFLTTGVFSNGNELNSVAQPGGSYTIGDTTYTAAEIGRLQGTVDFPSVAGYLGVGVGSAFDQGRHWGWLLDAGVLFQGSLDVKLEADSPLAANPQLQADLKAEEESLKDELEDYRYYPVISLGVSYQF